MRCVEIGSILINKKLIKTVSLSDKQIRIELKNSESFVKTFESTDEALEKFKKLKVSLL